MGRGFGALAGSVVRLGGEISDYKVIERYPLEASEAYGVLAALGREECKNVDRRARRESPRHLRLGNDPDRQYDINIADF
jgi:hypothetical protein